MMKWVPLYNWASNSCADQINLQYVDAKEDAAVPTTPRKRQRLATNATPKSQRKKALTTPTHKRYELVELFSMYKC